MWSLHLLPALTVTLILSLANGQSTTSSPPAPSNNQRLLRVPANASIESSCLYAYYESAAVSIYRMVNNPQGRKERVPLKEFELDSITAKPDVKESHCWAGKNTTAVLEMRWEPLPNNTGNFTMDMVILQGDEKNDFWHVSTISADFTNTSGEHYKFDFHSIVRPLSTWLGARQAIRGFSFSCSQLRLSGSSNISSSDNAYFIDMAFSRFQLQPFHINVTRGALPVVFGESFDCATFMTTPLWTCLLILLLYLVILGAGVYMLMEIKTPDRFENPKGKTLLINTTDE